MREYFGGNLDLKPTPEADLPVYLLPAGDNRSPSEIDRDYFIFQMELLGEWPTPSPDEPAVEYSRSPVEDLPDYIPF